MAINDPGPYVDSPGGKILAVAVCYWNGTAWVGPDTPGTYVDTPGGRMKAAAFFSWNGSGYTARTNLGM